MALAKSGALEEMKKNNIKYVFYHQIDNIIVKMADPLFLGYHIRKGAEASCKAVEKDYPGERVGVFGKKDGAYGIIEYSELSDEMRHARNKTGEYTFRHGNVAIHMFNVEFLERLTQGESSLPYHRAIKKVHTVRGEQEVMKFEMFIFDALEHAKEVVILEVEREEEFAPVKNATGVDSAQSAVDIQTRMFSRWLEDLGIEVPRDPKGNIVGHIEISPLFALDQHELKSKLDPKKVTLKNGEGIVLE